MIVLQITNAKDFMNKLLLSETFDNFLLMEATIQTNVTYVIDGHIHSNFYTEDELTSTGLAGHTCIPFSMLRPNCLNMIKGKKTPSQFKFVFMLSPENLDHTLMQSKSDFHSEDISGIFINICYRESNLTCSSGISYRTFSLDHTLDFEWDLLLQKFLTNQNISYSEVS